VVVKGEKHLEERGTDPGFRRDDEEGEEDDE